MVALFDVRQARELISGDFATNRTNLLVPSSSGMAGEFSGTANQQYAHRAAYAVTGDITIVVVCDVNALTNYNAVIAKQGTTSRNIPYELRLGAGATDSKVLLARGSATDSYSSQAASNLITAPAKNVSIIVRSVNLANTKVSVNGITTEEGIMNIAPTDNGATVWIGRRYDGATQFAGNIYYIALFNRSILDAETAKLNDIIGRWSVYAPQERKIFVSAAAPPAGGFKPYFVRRSSTIIGSGVK
jgi:hypothetical protein